MGAMREEAGALVQVVAQTAELADKISGKVRQLDMEQSRVRQVVAMVDDIQELRVCAKGAKEAARDRDYEIAAAHMKRYLNFDLDALALIFENSVPPSIMTNSESGSSSAAAAAAAEAVDPTEFPLWSLQRTQKELSQMLIREFDDAIQSFHEESILRLVKLFPMIGYGEIGLDKYSSFLSSLISRNSQDRMKAIGDTTSDPLFANLLTSLFESVAKIIDRQYHLVESCYGVSKMLLVIQKLQRQAEIQASIILESFAEKKATQRMLYDIKQSKEHQRSHSGYHPKSSSGSSGSNNFNNNTDTSLIELRDLDLTLHEIALMSQRFILFDRFIRMRAKEELDKRKYIQTDEKDYYSFTEIDSDGLALGGKLQERMTLLLADYFVMQDFYIRKSIEKALRLDKHEQGSLTSSCVDDVFFILKKCTHRCLTSSSMRTLSSFMSNLGKLLEAEYVSNLQRRLQGAFSAIDSKDSKIGFMILLNNFEMSCNYVKRLADDLSIEISSEARKKMADIDMAKSSISLFHDYSKTLRESVKIWMENFYNSTLKSKLRLSLLESHKEVQYVLSEQEFNSGHDSFSARFLGNVEKYTRLYKTSLTDGNFVLLTYLIVDMVTKELEKLCLSSKFNQLGALQFDKSLRSIVTYFSSVISAGNSIDSAAFGAPTSAIRDKFIRLNQISSLLNSEQVRDVQDLWPTDGGLGAGIKWRLGQAEVRKILVLRVDFGQSEVNALKL